MKDKIIFLIVGILLGTIISTGSIYFYTLAESTNNPGTQQDLQAPGTPPSGKNGGMNGSTPPNSMPANSNSQSN